MKIISNWSDDAPWGVVPYMHETLATFNDENSDEVLMNGAAWIYHKNIAEPFKNYKRRCLLALWSPCEFTSKKNYYHFDYYDFFTDVYCVCPFTCKLMNDYFGYEKFKYIPYPYTNTTVTEFGNYDADCSWVGSIHGDDHIKAVECISNFQYKFITSQRNTWMRHPHEFNKCTHVMLSNEQKLIELSKCKSSLSFNMIYMSPNSIKNDGEAFELFDQGIMPQFKVRCHEIASCKSLMLVKKDPWNLIEDFYEPEKEFLYFENFDELRGMLEDISTNIDKYTNIIEAAYTKSKTYEVDKIFNYIKKNDNNLITWRNKHV